MGAANTDVEVPSILIPSGLQKVHPQLELSIKSIKAAVSALHVGVNANASQANNTASLASQIAALQAQVNAIQAEIDALSPPTVYTAAAALLAYTAVYESIPGRVSVADNTTSAKSYAVVGITISAAAVGADALLARNGDTVTNSLWSFTPKQLVFLGLNGGLTQSPPTSGFVAPVGVAVSASSIFIAIGEPEGFSSTNTDAVIGRSASGQLNEQWLPLLPSLNTVPVGKSVTVPEFANLLIGTNGIEIDGDLDLQGDLEQLSMPGSGGGVSTTQRTFGFFCG